MKVFHIDDFKCTLCSNWFCPPFTLPYRLKCTHSICTNCLEKSVSNHTNQIICPEDLQNNQISDIVINQSTKKALQRLLKQHKNFTQTNHLECIKSLSIAFDQLLDFKQVELKNLSTLIDQIFENQIKRLREIYEKIKIEINRPFRIVNDWKEVVRNYLKKVKNQGSNTKGCVSQFNHYIEEGRKIKLDLNEYIKHDFRDLIDQLLIQPQVCFTHAFSIFDRIENQENRKNYCSTSKFETLGKRFETLGKKVSDQRQVCLQDMTNNFDQSSILMGKKTLQNDRSNSNRLSLFQSLIQETPKHQKCSNSQIHQDSKQTPLKQMIFSSVQNLSSQKQLKARIKVKVEENLNINSQFQPFNGSNQKINQNYSEKANFSTFESDKNNYNSVILEKINKTKQKNHEQSTKKPIRMGKSLQYSPDQQNYEPFQYNLHDSFEEQGNSCQNGKQLSLHSFYLDETIHLNTGAVETKSVSEFKPSIRKEADEPQEQFLLDEKSSRDGCVSQKLKRNEWSLEHLNFLREWKIEKDGRKEEELEIIQKYGGYDCEKEKNRYARKIQEMRVKEVLRETIINDNFISIVGQNLSECNLLLLFSQIDWNYRTIEIVKLIKTGLNDIQLNQLLNFLVRSKVHTLMLSYNNLTELSLDALLHFVSINFTLKNIYLPKNNISLLKGNARLKINLLKQKGINLYI